MSSSWAGTGLEAVYSSEQDDLRGWRGGDGSIWIVDDATMFRLRGGRKYPVNAPGFSAATSSTSIPRRRRVWVATSEGLARYTPLCAATDGVEDLDLPVHAIAEYPRAAMMSATSCVLESMRKVDPHALPAGFRTHTLETGAWCRFRWQGSGKSGARGGCTDAVLAMGARAANLPFFRTLRPVHRHDPAAPGGGSWVVSEVKGVLATAGGLRWRQFQRSWNWAANGGAPIPRWVLAGARERYGWAAELGAPSIRDGCFSGPFQLSDGQTEPASSFWAACPPANSWLAAGTGS